MIKKKTYFRLQLLESWQLAQDVADRGGGQQ